MAKRTALYEEHLKLKGKIVEFGGWDMPVQYSGLSDEHETCRTKVGLFDVSHMGEVVVKGPQSLDFLNRMVTNDVSKIKDNQAQYTVMCYEHGGCVDDLIIHRINQDEFFVCVNASNADKDFQWLKSHETPGVSVENVSDQWSQIAVQGRQASAVLTKLTPFDLTSIKYYWFTKAPVLGIPALIARTGYTGEDGFEVYVPWNDGPRVWRALLEAGEEFGIKPCGLGARDTLRTEMKFPLYGHEISETHNPLEAGLGWVTKFTKQDFVGKAALLALKEKGLKRTLVGLKSLGRAIPRQGYKILKNGVEIGEVTSGTLSPSLKTGIAIASLDKDWAAIGSHVDVAIRDQLTPHEIIETPFYKRPY